LKRKKPLKVDDLARFRGDIVVLEDLKIAGNIGAILRTSVALGVGAVVLLGENSPSLYDRRIVRASRGHVFSLPVLKTTPEAFLMFSRHHDVPLLVTSPHGGQNFHDIIKAPQRLAIAFGDEKSGCSETLLRAARFQVALPTTPVVESLNVSVTAGIVLYQRFVSRLN
jgi:23S rRNA (adenosine1067-2'-O)-methyltransferase